MEGSASDKEAWELVQEMLAAVLQEIIHARSAVTSDHVLGNSDPITRVSAALWGTLQGHRVMEDIAHFEFRRHPCVMPTQTRFLYTHRAPIGKVKNHEAEIKELRKRDAERQSTIDKLEARLRRLESAKGK